MRTIKYSIGTDPMAKKYSTKLHLWREDTITFKIATFANPGAAEMFAKEFDFPLADSTREIITKWKESANA